MPRPGVRALAAGFAAVAVTAAVTVHEPTPAASSSPSIGPRHDPAGVFTAAALDDHAALIRLRAVEREHLTARPRTVRSVKHRRPAVRHRTGSARVPAGRPAGIPVVWWRLALCESSGDWRYGGPGGHVDAGYAEYEGGFNFARGTWDSHRPAGFPTRAWAASPTEQLVVARRVLADEGVNAWPACGPRVGLRRGD